MVLSIDPERERISLGVKQLAKDPFSTWIAEHPKGTIVKGTVREVDAKGAIIDLGGGIEGHLRASELSRDRVEDARTVLKVGDEVEAKFTAVDRKSRTDRAVDQGEGHRTKKPRRCRATAPASPRPAPASATCSRSTSAARTTTDPSRPAAAARRRGVCDAAS